MLFELTKAVEIVNETAGADAQVIWGHSIDEEMGDAMRITVIATGFAENAGPTKVSKLTPEHVGGHSLTDVRFPPKGSGSEKRGFEEVNILNVGDEDMFMGTTRTAYDSPAYIRKKQK
jgi:cell division GTPase FtsZ